jgi:hypothetical protein
MKWRRCQVQCCQYRRISVFRRWYLPVPEDLGDRLALTDHSGHSNPLTQLDLADHSDLKDPADHSDLKDPADHSDLKGRSDQSLLSRQLDLLGLVDRSDLTDRSDLKGRSDQSLLSRQLDLLGLVDHSDLTGHLDPADQLRRLHRLRQSRQFHPADQ